jgi:peptidoglycan/xylan/chitin deacetylase (PgdA/CDA1 family)
MNPIKRKPAPKKLSSLLRYAVASAQEIARLPGVKLDMMTFGSEQDGVCYLCMGAAAAVKGGHITPTPEQIENTQLEAFANPSVGAIMNAVDSMRTGFFDAAGMELGIFGGTDEDYRAVTTERQRKALDKAHAIVNKSFRIDRDEGRATWGAYLKAADALAEGGL